jgi:hypothetical protein
LPLVGGELARAAFEHGFEQYGVEQLLKYEQLTHNNETYLWYFPDGRQSTVETSTSPDASPTDGWGSSAMLYALFEGLAGVVDQGKLFQEVRISPRWVAAQRAEASVCASYGASGASVEYTFGHNESAKTIELQLKGNARAHLHVLLPEKAKSTEVTIGKKKLNFRNAKIEESSYVDVDVDVNKSAVVLIRYQ